MCAEPPTFYHPLGIRLKIHEVTADSSLSCSWASTYFKLRLDENYLPLAIIDSMSMNRWFLHLTETTVRWSFVRHGAPIMTGDDWWRDQIARGMRAPVPLLFRPFEGLTIATRLSRSQAASPVSAAFSPLRTSPRIPFRPLPSSNNNNNHHHHKSYFSFPGSRYATVENRILVEYPWLSSNPHRLRGVNKPQRSSDSQRISKFLLFLNTKAFQSTQHR